MIAEYNLKKVASSFRTSNGLGAKDPINTKSLLLKLKILTVFKQIRADFSGMAIKVNGYSFILINSNQTIGRQNFTIAHELYHLFIDKDFVSTLCHTETENKTSSSEKNADLFASYLLTPEEGLLDIISEAELSKNKISLPTILEIEHYFACSRKALLMRLKNMNLIDDIHFRRFKEKIKLEATLLGFDTALYEPGNHNLVIGDYAKIAKKLYDNEIISESNLISYFQDIGMSVEDLNLNAKIK